MSINLGLGRFEDGKISGKAGRDPGHVTRATDLIPEAANDGS